MSDETLGTNGRDPTANTRALIGDAVQRLDDLAKAETRRVNELMAAETRRVNEQADLRALYDSRLDVAETNRLNALRAGDENSRAIDREKAAAQASVLATAVTTTADTLRALVASKADDQAKQLDQRIGPILDKLTALEQAQFTGVGERRATDPLQTQLAEDVRALLRSREKSEGRAGISVPMLAMIATFVGGLVVFLIERSLK